MRVFPTTVLAVMLVAASASPAFAQPLGTFHWQLQPYCNLIALRVTLEGAVYRLEGTDDRCGTQPAASAEGVAFLNSDGSATMALTGVYPGGIPLHLEAIINLSTMNGTWRDSAGNTGQVILTPGTGSGGRPRAVPSGGLLAPDTVSVAQLAAGAVTGAHLAANSVTGAKVADGSLTGVDLAPVSITSAHLAPAAVGPGRIAPNSINGSALVDASVGGADLQASIVTTEHVVDGSLRFRDLAGIPRAAAVEQSLTYTVDRHTVLSDITMVAPAQGRILVMANVTLTFPSNVPIDARCALTTGTSATAPLVGMLQSPPLVSVIAPIGGTRVFAVTAGSSTTVRFVCHSETGPITADSVVISALFVADP